VTGSGGRVVAALCARYAVGRNGYNDRCGDSRCTLCNSCSAWLSVAESFTRITIGVAPLDAEDGQAATGHVTKGLGEVVWNDPLAANEARMAAVLPHTRDPLLAWGL